MSFDNYTKVSKDDDKEILKRKFDSIDIINDTKLRDCINCTAFHGAVRNHDCDMIHYYLSMSTTPSNTLLHCSLMNGKKPIHQAWRRLKNTTDIQTFIPTVMMLVRQHDIDINSQDNHGRTLLFYVCFLSSLSENVAGVEVVKFLLDNGADPVLGEIFRWAMNHCAIHARWDADIIKILLYKLIVRYRCDVNCKGYPPIPSAIRILIRREPILHHFCAAVDLLLNHKADINSQDINGRTALSILCSIMHYKSDPILYNAADFLLSKGANPNIGRGRNGWNPLTMACRNGDIDLIQILLEYHTIDVGQTTAFHNIGHRNENYSYLVRLLIQKGADINSQDYNGNTILHLALLRQHPNVWRIKFLLNECNAHYLYNKNHNGKSPWDIIMDIRFQYNNNNTSHRTKPTIYNIKISKHKKKRYEKMCYVMEQKKRQQIYTDLWLLLFPQVNNS